MTTESERVTPTPSRRAMLAGVLGGIGAWAAGAFGRVSSVSATDGQPILQGVDNGGTISTVVRVSTATAALQGVSDAGSGTAYGVRGRNLTANGAGVLGVAGASTGAVTGVLGTATSNMPSASAVRGDASQVATGMRGIAENGVGVWGSSAALAPFTGVGVFGYAPLTSGVLGSTDKGNGVWGRSETGRGVQGTSMSGYAGWFGGKVYATKWYELQEIAAPAKPAATRARLFLRDSNGRTQLCVRFGNGQIKVLAAET